MNKPKTALFAGIGSLFSPLIFGLLYGLLPLQDKTAVLAAAFAAAALWQLILLGVSFLGAGRRKPESVQPEIFDAAGLAEEEALSGFFRTLRSFFERQEKTQAAAAAVLKETETLIPEVLAITAAARENMEVFLPWEVFSGEAEENQEALEIPPEAGFSEGRPQENALLEKWEAAFAAGQILTDSLARIKSVVEKQENEGRQLTQTLSSQKGELGATAAHIQEIKASIDIIIKAAGVIRAVSAGTTFLALNAAIEAAHAGKSGRGFAVVADEIRKLADTSSENSERITAVVKVLVEKIQDVVRTSEETGRSFHGIGEKIADFSVIRREYAENLDLFAKEGRDILENLETVRRGLREIQNDSPAAGEMTSARKLEEENRKRTVLEIRKEFAGLEGQVEKFLQSLQEVEKKALAWESFSPKKTPEITRLSGENP